MRYAKCPIIEVTKKFKEDGKLISVRKALFIKSEQRNSANSNRKNLRLETSRQSHRNVEYLKRAIICHYF